MKSKALKLLLAVLGSIGIVLILIFIIGPNFTGKYYREGAEEYWKAFKVKHRTMNYCKDCHSEQYERIINSKHAKNQCENCHGPAIDHPEKPEKLAIDRRRELCLRCHAYLPYRPTVYAQLSGAPLTLKEQDPETHNPGIECLVCHSAHDAKVKIIKNKTGR